MNTKNQENELDIITKFKEFILEETGLDVSAEAEEFTKRRERFYSELKEVVERDVILAVEEFYHLPLGTLFIRTRKKPYPEARSVYATIMKPEYSGMSLKIIGSRMGGRDHSTVIHSLRSFSNDFETDKNFRARVRTFLATLNLEISDNEIITPLNKESYGNNESTTIATRPTSTGIPATGIRSVDQFCPAAGN